MKVEESIKAAIVPITKVPKRVKIVVVRICTHLNECRPGPAIIKFKITQVRINYHDTVIRFL